MAPKTQGGNKNTPKKPLIRHHSSEIAAIDYGAVQKDEIEALQAIFMDDFEEIQVEGAWNKTTDHRFKLRVASFEDIESFIVLTVRLTATYPKTVPLIEIDGLDKFHERTQQRINVILHNRPKQLLGEVMIHAIATEIQDALEDAVQARQQGTLPSLIEERANAEEVATALAKQAEDAEAIRQKELHDEEEKALSRLVEQELSRREKRKTGRSTDNISEQAEANEIVSFDEPADIVVGQEVTSFQSISIVSKDGNSMIAKPRGPGVASSALVRVRRCTVKSDRSSVTDLETTLKQVRGLRHRNITILYQYRFDKQSDNMVLTLCTELNPGGSLQDFLSIAMVIHIDKARQFSINLLEALEEYHRHGIAHGYIACMNIEIDSSMAPKLTDGIYATCLRSDRCLPRKWLPPEDVSNSSSSLLKKADIWSLGVVIIQMCLGLDVISQYSSPQSLFNKAILSESFNEFVSRMCHIDSKKRPSAFDLLAAEFLRSSDPATSANEGRSYKAFSLGRDRSRHGSLTAQVPSRYVQDFTEIGRLGKGGFGEVVKARNKLDGGIYAVKKIARAPQLDQILSEVMLLNRLNHPYVVRYYSTWVEEAPQASGEEDSSMTETITEDQELDFGLPSTGGLDFVSSSGYPLIEFGVDSDDDGDINHSSDSSNKEQRLNSAPALDGQSSDDRSLLHVRRMRSASRKVQSTLYIQMEFCERRTLRDLIRKGLGEDDCWTFIRQITEGLAHVHSHGIIHRDLKPDNVFLDVAGNPKIGDFGLATTAQYHATGGRSQALNGNVSVDMTMSIGTAMYMAPELGASHGSGYNEKVDMYSLGIIFFEMCEPFATSMERIKALQDIRKKEHVLPEPYLPPSGAKVMQGKVISCLIAHKPSERPSSLELLRTDLLPVKIEDETIRQALSSLADPRSPNNQKMMSALFAHDQAAENQVKAMAWDAKDQTDFDEPLKLRMKAIARDALVGVFKLHGAEEIYRDHIFPRSTHYTANNVFQLLDASGNLLQLPFDLTLPLARKLAHSHQTTRCTYAFGQVFRDTFAGGPPTTNEEVDFDIVTDPRGSDLTFDDAEVLKAVDDIVTDPTLMLNLDATCFHINHTAVLDAILSFCRIPLPQYAGVKECISKLGFRQFTWSKIRNELRSHAIGLSIAAVDDLEQFDFRDAPEKALTRIKEIIGTSEVSSSFENGAEHLLSIVRHALNLKISRKIWLAPLSCFNAKFYDDGLLLQCVHQRKTNRDVLAAGGRYSGLVKACGRPNVSGPSQGVVGISIGFDRLVAHMLKQAKAESKSAFLKDKSQDLTLQKRCEVCLLVGRGEAVKDAGMRLLAALWQGNISAELVTEEHAGNSNEHAFHVVLRHEASTTVKVRNLESDSTETEIPITSLITHLNQELRERQVSKRKQPMLGRQRSQNTVEIKGNVQVLMSQHRSKKSNKYNIVEAAQQRWVEKLDQWKDAPILAVETRDDVIELLRETRLSDAESWKKALHAVPPNERQYLQQVQELLISWRKRWQEEDGMREACIFNFRTGHGIYYDLGL